MTKRKSNVADSIKGAYSELVLSDFDKEVFIRTLYGECDGEDELGQCLVAEVILNRAIKKKESVTEICMKPKQFSCWTDTDEDSNYERIIRLGRLNERYKHFDKIISSVMSCEYIPWMPSNTFHYHTYNVNPVWSKNVTPVKEFGNHKFFAGITF